jgi:aliphatic nitrilase
MTEAIRIRAASHAFEGKVFVVVSSSIVSPEIIDSVCVYDEQRRQMQERPASISVIYGPDGQPVSEPLIDAEGIVYGEIEIEKEIEPKQFHDVFSLHLNRRQIQPLSREPVGPIGDLLTADAAPDLALPPDAERLKLPHTNKEEP